jgi:hypothetical protein
MNLWVNQSGLSERYDFTFASTPDAAQAALIGCAPDLLAAFPQQLGFEVLRDR